MKILLTNREIVVTATKFATAKKYFFGGIAKASSILSGKIVDSFVEKIEIASLGCTAISITRKDDECILSIDEELYCDIVEVYGDIITGMIGIAFTSSDRVNAMIHKYTAVTAQEFAKFFNEGKISIVKEYGTERNWKDEVKAMKTYPFFNPKEVTVVTEDGSDRLFLYHNKSLKHRIIPKTVNLPYDRFIQIINELGNYHEIRA